jgi:hypothetical protein
MLIALGQRGTDEAIVDFVALNAGTFNGSPYGMRRQGRGWCVVESAAIGFADRCPCR